MMHILNSPQNGGISPVCRQRAWSQLYGNMHVGVPVEIRNQAQPQSDCGLPKNVDVSVMQNQVMACRADLMTVDQTAAWVRTLGYFNGWGEVIEYEKNFRSNQIKGYMLQSLTLESLKSDLGIWKYGHRLEIMNAIKSLFPSMGELSSNMANSTVSSNSIYSPMLSSGIGSPLNTFYSPVVTFGTPQSVPQSMGVCYSPNVRSDIVGIRNGSPTRTSGQCMETVSDFGNRGNGSSTIISEKSAMHHYGSDFEKIPSSKGMHSYANTYEKDQSKVAKIVKKKSKRVGPSNPVEYMALCEVQIRGGKSASSKVVGELKARQTVVINQIKGRSGRVVVKGENGKYTKKGWVSLFTGSGRQRFVKCCVYMNEMQKMFEQQGTGNDTTE